MQDTNGAVIDSGAVFLGVQVLSPGFGEYKLDAVFIDKVSKHSDGVGAAAYARHDEIRKRADTFLELCLGLRRNDAVQLADNGRVRVRAGRGAEKVVRLVQGGGSITQCLVHRVLERAGACIDGYDLRPHVFHSEDVRLLALHVLGSHLNTHSRSRRAHASAVAPC